MLSINPATGAVVWDVALLPPVPATALPCGDVDPVQVRRPTLAVMPDSGPALYPASFCVAEDTTGLKLCSAARCCCRASPGHLS